MAFKKDIAMSNDEAGVSSYRESMSSKLGELKQNMLDMEDVLGGHGQKSVAVEPETPSHKRGPTVSGDTRACKP